MINIGNTIPNFLVLETIHESREAKEIHLVLYNSYIYVQLFPKSKVCTEQDIFYNVFI